jgi:chaperonin cofactor prefoldin
LTQSLEFLIVDLYGKENHHNRRFGRDDQPQLHRAQKHTDAQLAALKGELTGIMKDMVEELTATHEDVRYIRTTVNLLVRNDVAQDAAINTLSARVARLEKKVGLTN